MVSLKSNLALFCLSLGIVITIIPWISCKAQTKPESYPNVTNVKNFHWQGLLSEEQLSYKEVMDITDRYFRNHPEQKEEQEETYKAYLRWKLFWKNRMTKSGEKITGSQYANQFLNNLYRRSIAMQKHGQISSYCQSFDYEPKWRLLGPKKKYEDQNRGRLISVAVHPNDTNTIYAGSWQSGLYRTTNNGKTQKNMTDSKQKALVFMIG